MPSSSTGPSARAPSVALFVDGADWHTRRLRAALTERGAGVTVISLRDCGLDTSERHGLRLPGFEGVLPDAVFVRTISVGSLEQITLRLGVLHALRELGVRVYNDARAIERCVDKSMTCFCLQQRDVPTPPTWTVESLDAARQLVREHALPERPLVLKPLFGSQGRGLRLVDHVDALPAPEETGGVYHLQHYVGARTAGWHDWRVFVTGGHAVAAMIRRGIEWRTNAARGARCAPAPAEGELARLAIAAADAVGADYAGVDLIADERGRLLVLEVNSMPAWKSLQQASGADIAGELAADLLSHSSTVPGKRKGTRVRAVASR